MCYHLLFSDWNHQSAEDAIAEQAKQQEDDPYANLSKKEKKKKKKQVNTDIKVINIKLQT